MCGVARSLLQRAAEAAGAGLRRLELHCPPESPVAWRGPGPAAGGLEWLRLGLYPLSSALALVRANAASLQELHLLAASEEPYGCPDLHLQLASCGLRALTKLHLLRGSADGRWCRHGKASCTRQKMQIWDALLETGVAATVTCSLCDKV